MFSSVTTKPGFSASRPTRDVAWMYSAAAFRLSLDHHQAEPADVETDRDHVGGERDVDRVLLAGRPSEAGARFGDLIGAVAGRELSDLAQVPVGEGMTPRLVPNPARPIGGE